MAAEAEAIQLMQARLALVELAEVALVVQPRMSELRRHDGPA